MSPATDDDWPALQAATAADPAARLPFAVQHQGRAWPAGSVARADLPALAALATPDALRIADDGVLLQVPADRRDAVLADLHAALRRQGLIRAWRDEAYGLHALPDEATAPAVAGPVLAVIERAASRFWGCLTFGAHANGYVPGADGRPSHLWIARRALDKPTDPGLLDNLIGGGVPHGQAPAEAVVREGWEEAGLRASQMQGLQPGRRLRLARDIAEGFQLEWLSVFDLPLPPGLTPVNQDGEVHSLTRMPIDQALACAARGEMTVDAALATLDFALRHGLLPEPARARLAAAAAALWLPGPP